MAGVRVFEAPLKSLEHQRRSRIDWFEILDEQDAVRQIAYERCKTVHRMRSLGFTLRQIGEYFGLTYERIRQMEFQHRRHLESGRKSPAEELFNADPKRIAASIFVWGPPHQT